MALQIVRCYPRNGRLVAIVKQGEISAAAIAAIEVALHKQAWKKVGKTIEVDGRHLEDLLIICSRYGAVQVMVEQAQFAVEQGRLF